MHRRLPQILACDEARRLLQTPSRYYPTGRRDLCMLNAGLRASEVLGLTWADLDLQTGKLVVRRGKGDKDRQLWINDDVLSLLRHWRGEAPPGRLCFPTLKGTRIYDAQLREMVKRRGRKAGIAKDVHPHMLRHYLPFLTMLGKVGKHLCKRGLDAAFTRHSPELFRKPKNRRRNEVARSVDPEPCESRIHLLSFLSGRWASPE
jgi:integrase